MKKQIWQIFILISMTTACSHGGETGESHASSSLSIKSLIKGDIDSVMDMQVHQMRQILRELMIKLYKRNPDQLKASPFDDIKKNVSRVFDTHHDWAFKQLDYKKDIDAIKLTFDDNYQGDRVFSFMVGISSMLMLAYGNKMEFYMLDDINAQSLYNSARNIEIAVWKLSNNRDKNGELYLYSNSLPNESSNLSYERLFGKLIALQDASATIIENKGNRLIRKIIQRMATTVAFLPI